MIQRNRERFSPPPNKHESNKKIINDVILGNNLRIRDKVI